jgi:hypothetical protein
LSLPKELAFCFSLGKLKFLPTSFWQHKLAAVVQTYKSPYHVKLLIQLYQVTFQMVSIRPPTQWFSSSAGAVGMVRLPTISTVNLFLAVGWSVGI